MPPPPRRILLLITDLQTGGTPTVVRELAFRLRQLPGVTVEVACLSPPGGGVFDQIRAAGVAVTALNGTSPRHFPSVVFRLYKLIRGGAGTEMVDVAALGFDTVLSFLVHANAVAAAAFVLCRVTGRPVRLLQSIQTTQPKPRWHWRVQAWADRAAERVVVPSTSVADVATRWAGVAPGKIVVVPNAIEPEEFDPSPVPAANPRPYPIGFLGRLDPIKRLPDLLQAVAALSGLVELHVFGEGAERPRIEAEVIRLKLDGLVHLHGAIARPQDALARVGLLVLPSEAEGFGLVLIEAMAAGVPVVATDVPGIRDVVRDGVTGLLVPPGRPDALAEAIRRVVENPALRRELIRAAAEDVRARFTWPGVMRMYEEVLFLSPSPIS